MPQAMKRKPVVSDDPANGSLNVTLQPSTQPLMYLDSMLNLGIGPFVSRVMLGVQTPGSNPPQMAPALTIVMPTPALHLLAREIMRALDNPANQQKLDEAFMQYQKDFRSGSDSE